MLTLLRLSFLTVTRLALLGSASWLFVSCLGDDGITRHRAPTVNVGIGAPWGTVQVDKTLAFRGQRFQLAAVQDAQFVDAQQFVAAGLGTVEGIEPYAVEVFLNVREAGSIYTMTEANQAPAWIRQATSSPVGALWYRWDLGS